MCLVTIRRLVGASRAVVEYRMMHLKFEMCTNENFCY